MPASPATIFETTGPGIESDRAVVRAILEVLRERTGIDFSDYRPSTIRRRVLNRMISVGADTFDAYLSFLLASDDEPLRLLERLTIKVSRFYRDAVTFDLLRRKVLPRLAGLSRRKPLRLWSAGCGYGEEAYTLAMLLADAGVPGQVEATDIDPAALEQAAAATYPKRALTELPADLASRYLQQVGEDAFTVASDVRSAVRFSPHDLLSEGPHPGGSELFDAVCCRNVLIYFGQHIQVHVLAGVRSAIRRGGYLCLGEAEWPMPAMARCFVTLNAKAKVFRHLASAAPSRSEGRA